MSEIPDKLFYKIGEICKYTDTQPYVLRFWESEFPQLTRTRNRGGQRVYSREDLNLVLKIKKLLSDQEYTIAGVRDVLEREEGASNTTATKRVEAREERPAEVPAEHADSYKASYELARQEIELLRQRLAEIEEKHREAQRERDSARERSERVAARLESLLASLASHEKRARST